MTLLIGNVTVMLIKAAPHPHTNSSKSVSVCLGLDGLIAGWIFVTMAIALLKYTINNPTHHYNCIIITSSPEFWANFEAKHAQFLSLFLSIYKFIILENKRT